MSQDAAIRNSLSPPMLARILAEQLCDTDAEDVARMVLGAGIGLVRQWCSAAEMQRFYDDLRADLQESAQQTKNPARAANAARALELVNQPA